MRRSPRGRSPPGPRSRTWGSGMPRTACCSRLHSLARTCRLYMTLTGQGRLRWARRTRLHLAQCNSCWQGIRRSSSAQSCWLRFSKLDYKSSQCSFLLIRMRMRDLDKLDSDSPNNILQEHKACTTSWLEGIGCCIHGEILPGTHTPLHFLNSSWNQHVLGKYSRRYRRFQQENTSRLGKPG